MAGAIMVEVAVPLALPMDAIGNTPTATLANYFG